MRMRFEATTRRPASSSFAVTAPVRLRRVASGLMIEKVRVTAMGNSLKKWGKKILWRARTDSTGFEQGWIACPRRFALPLSGHARQMHEPRNLKDAGYGPSIQRPS